MPRRVKILNVLPFDHSGSIQNRSLKVALYAEQYNIETVFILPKDGDGFSKSAKKQGMRFIKTRVLRPVVPNSLRTFLHLIRWFILIPINMIEFLLIVSRENPDIIQINGFVCIQEAIVTSLFHRKKMIWNLIGNIYPRILVSLFSPFIRLARVRLFVSSKLIPYYFGMPDDMVIFEPVDIDLFSKKDNLDLMTTTLGIPESSPDSYLIGFVGAPSPIKGLEYLIESLKIVKEEFDNIRLVIVGGIGPHQKLYFQKLKMLTRSLNLKHNVIFTHWIPNDEIPNYLELFDIFVLPSLHEGTPVCILEAMAMELPIVASDVGGISELVIDGETGYLVPSKDSQAFAAAVMDLLKSPNKRKMMGLKGRNRVEQLFTIDTCVNTYHRLYLSLCFQ